MSSITGDWKSIEGSDIRARRPITAANLEQLLKNAVSLYEALADTTAPSANPAQEYVGHDHGFSGGAPITHGCIACVEGIDAVIFSHTPAATPSAAKERLTRFPVNPGIWIQSGSEFEVWVRCLSVNGPFRISVEGGPPLIIDATAEASGPRWHRLTGRAGRLFNHTEGFVFSVEMLGSVNDSPRFDLYGITAAETPNASTRHVTGVRLPPPTTGTEVWSYFGELDPELGGSDEWVDAELLILLESAIAALHEHTTDTATPGASSQYIKGHDHSTNGGRPVCMGLCFSTGADASLSLTAPFAQVCTTQNTWYFIDQGAATQRSAGTAGSSVTTGTWWFPVSPGITSTGNPPTTAPSLYGEIQTTFTGAASPTVEARLHNVATGDYSETITLTGGGSTDSFSRIPCSGGVWNELTLEVRCTSHAAITVDLDWMAIYEIPWASATQVSEVSSSGSRILGTLTGRP